MPTYAFGGDAESILDTIESTEEMLETADPSSKDALHEMISDMRKEYQELIEKE